MIVNRMVNFVSIVFLILAAAVAAYGMVWGVIHEVGDIIEGVETDTLYVRPLVLNAAEFSCKYHCASRSSYVEVDSTYHEGRFFIVPDATGEMYTEVLGTVYAGFDFDNITVDVTRSSDSERIQVIITTPPPRITACELDYDAALVVTETNYGMTSYQQREMFSEYRHRLFQRAKSRLTSEAIEAGILDDAVVILDDHVTAFLESIDVEADVSIEIESGTSAKSCTLTRS